MLAMRLPAHAQEDRNNRIGIDAIRIEVAETHVQRMLAHDLLSQQYRKAGYLPPPFSWPCAQEITLLALHGHRAVATLTIRVDSQAAGLLADHRYGPLLNQYRADGHVLCEFIRFAIDSDAPVMQVLGKLLETGWPKAARQFGATDVFVECHPRHSAFYRRALAFKIIGSETTCERVAVLRPSCCICRSSACAAATLLTATNASKVAPANSARTSSACPTAPSRAGSAGRQPDPGLPAPASCPIAAAGHTHSATDSRRQRNALLKQRNISLRRPPYIIAVALLGRK
ncbi:MAG: hypothetical protein EKK65_15360 [Lysobacterales bacterium]|nr:MAG: hypothetical protein EKK65_15360 [Xanthomonadales bacterium]